MAGHRHKRDGTVSPRRSDRRRAAALAKIAAAPDDSARLAVAFDWLRTALRHLETHNPAEAQAMAREAADRLTAMAVKAEEIIRDSR